MDASLRLACSALADRVPGQLHTYCTGFDPTRLVVLAVAPEASHAELEAAAYRPLPFSAGSPPPLLMLGTPQGKVTLALADGLVENANLVSEGEEFVRVIAPGS